MPIYLLLSIQSWSIFGLLSVQNSCCTSVEALRNLKVLSIRDMYCLTMNLTVFDNMAITKSGRNQEENVVVRQHMSVK